MQEQTKCHLSAAEPRAKRKYCLMRKLGQPFRNPRRIRMVILLPGNPALLLQNLPETVNVEFPRSMRAVQWEHHVMLVVAL